MGVSRRWRRVCFAEPALWHSFTVHAYRASEAAGEQALRLGCRAALLWRVARHMRCFRWEENTEEWQLTVALCLYHCLAALRGSQLEQLQLSGPCTSLAGPDAEAALQQLGSTVASLHLGACSAGPAAFAAAALGSRLRSLQLSTRELPPALLGSIVRMPQLAALRIEAYAWPDLGPLARISQLRQLVLLDLRVDGEDSLQPPEPASFPSSLDCFSCESKHRSFEVVSCLPVPQCMALLGPCRLHCTWPTFSRVPAYSQEAHACMYNTAVHSQYAFPAGGRLRAVPDAAVAGLHPGFGR